MKMNPRSHLGPVRRFFSILLLTAAVAAAFGAVATSRPLSRPNEGKIAPWVARETANGQEAEFLIILADQADLSAARNLQTKAEKGRFVRDALWNKSQVTQGPLLQWLRARKIEHRAFYIVNSIWVKANAAVVQALAARPDVLRIEGNPKVRAIPEVLPVEEVSEETSAPASIEQGIAYTHAPQVWALGYTGQGIVVAGMDTGYRWTHNALKNHYRGWDGTAANHDYNWHDAIHSGGGSCGPDSPVPCDDNTHGTHTMGTAVGDDGSGNQIGMAPGAKWIGCRNMDQGVGSPARYMECFEFCLAPYPVGGDPSQGDSSKAPDVSTNSWICGTDEGCSALTLEAAVAAQRAAGIMTVAAAGNDGANCSTIAYPPAIYDETYTVGALNNGTDTIAGFSSRGPVVVDNSMRLKPDLCAPGTNVRSSFRDSDSSYGYLSGTSMASPHVAGAVALLLSAQAPVRRNQTLAENILNKTAVAILSNTCDNGSPPASPNNTYGYGRLDIKAAVDDLEVLSVASVQTQGGQSFGIPLPLTGEPGVECRLSDTYTLVFTFNNNVVSGNAAVSSGQGSVLGNPSFAANTMTVNLTGVADVQRIAVSVTNVTGTFAQVASATTVSMNLLVGDTNGNKSVTASDLGDVKARSGQVLDASNFRDDVNRSGAISSSDVSVVKANSGHSLP